jgi:hypothetical protein
MSRVMRLAPGPRSGSPAGRSWLARVRASLGRPPARAVVRRSLDQRGTTVMEIVFAVAIIAVGLVALASAIPISAYGIQEGSQLSAATFLANQRLEQVRNARWQVGTPCVDHLGLSPSSAAPPVGTCAGGGVTFADEQPMAAPHTAYARTVRVTACDAAAPCDGIASDELRRATVTVAYRPMTGVGVSAAGTAKTAVLTMYIAKR